MSNILQLLEDLRQQQIKIWAEGDRLRVKAPEGVVSPALRAQLAERKAEILAFLAEAHLHAGLAGRGWSPLVPIHPQGCRPPLFVVHPGGGHVLCYYNLARHLGADQPLYGLQARGLEAGQDPIPRIDDMATAYLDAVKSVQPHGPYWLAGWSFGGYVAFEMAHQLSVQHQDVAFLGMFDTPSPPIIQNALAEKPLPDNDAEGLLLILGLDEIPGFDQAELGMHLQQLDPDQQLLYIISEGRRAYPLPEDVDAEAARRFVQVNRTEDNALLKHVFTPYTGKITYFQAQERERDRGWEDFTDQALDIHLIPGNHHSLMLEPNIRMLAEQLRDCLVRAADTFS